MVTFAFIACLIACGCFGSSPSVPKSDEDAIKKAVIEEYGNRDKAIKVVKVKIKKFDVKSAEVTATLTWPEFHSVGQKRNVKLKKENGKWVVLSVEER